MNEGTRVKILVPYTGCGERLFDSGIITEVLGAGQPGTIISVSPYTKRCTCHGRVTTLHVYGNRYVDFAPRELRVPYQVTNPWAKARIF